LSALRRHQPARLAFFTAQCLVLLLLIFIAGLSNWIPRYFLG